MSEESTIYINNGDITLEIENVSDYIISPENVTISDYNKLVNLPSINSKKITGNVSLDELGIPKFSDLELKENLSNKANVINADSNDTEYPSAKAVYKSIKDFADKNLSNLTDVGKKVILENSNVNINVLSQISGEISEDEKWYKNICEYNRSTFDVSKFTVVGNPVITDAGILYTKEADELQCVATTSLFNIDANSNFKVQMLCKVKNLSTINVWSSFLNFTKNAIYCATKNTMSLILYPNQFTLRLGSSSASYLGDVSIPHSTSGVTEDVFIPIEIIVNKNSYTLSVNGKSVSNTLEGMDVTDLICVLGNCGGAANPVPYGEIDLAQFSITVDGQEVFNGNKTGLDVIKQDDYTVVGSPTISEDGVASGFSDTSGIEAVITIDTSTYCKISISFTTAETRSATNKRILRSVQYGKLMVCDADYLRIWLGEGSDWNIYEGWQITDEQLEANKTYKLDIEYTGTTYNVYLDNKLMKSFVSSVNVFNGSTGLRIGYDSISATNFFTGSIDLNSFKIYVDGNLVYQPCLKIPYNLSKTGSKIVPSYARNRVIDLYEQEGQAGYYTIDEENKNFTLPMGELYGMIGQNNSKIENTKETLNTKINAEVTSIEEVLETKANLDLANVNANGSNLVLSWMMPDYAAGIAKASNTIHQADVDGWLYLVAQANGNNVVNFRLDIGETESLGSIVAHTYNGTGKNDGDCLYVPIPKGYYYKITSNDSYSQVSTFYPCKGGN